MQGCRTSKIARFCRFGVSLFPIPFFETVCLAQKEILVGITRIRREPVLLVA